MTKCETFSKFQMDNGEREDIYSILQIHWDLFEEKN